MKLQSRSIILYLVAFLSSVGATMLTLGIFYFTARLWGWDAKRNLALAAAQGVFYIVSALMAHAVSARLGRRKSLVVIYSIMTLISGVTGIMSSHLFASACLIAYMFITGMNWPMLESLCAEAPDAHEMSRRVGAYNLTWAIAGAVALFITGLLIEHWPAGVFVLPAVFHGVCALAMLVLLLRDRDIHHDAQLPHADPEPDLLRSRKLALWLSRISLPAMYVVNFGLGAILPTLPVLQHFTPVMQTLCGSVWVVARLIGFAVLGATVFWHARPRLLLVASVALLAGFLIVTLPPSQMIDSRISYRADLMSMMGGQILLGIAMAMIYTASLYFGMVLSDGSTEHGGYHEALIGLGGVLGPGAGAITQCFWPGDVSKAVVAVGGVVAFSVVGGWVVSIVLQSTSSSALTAGSNQR